MVCVSAGDPDPDIGGPGVSSCPLLLPPSILTQRTTNSAKLSRSLLHLLRRVRFRLSLPFVSSCSQRRSNAGRDGFRQRSLAPVIRLQLLVRIDPPCNDKSLAETHQGIAVCVGGFATHDSISLYHLRMLFDLIGLTT